jgi:hypothetical protein
MSRAELEAHLRSHSGLPGPRANLALADAFGALQDHGASVAFATSDDEFVAMCGALGLAAEPDDNAARRLASDERWRVREAVARGLQSLGRRDPAEFRRVGEAWGDDSDPLVQRAAIAALCEPPLLRDRETAVTALAVTRRVTASLLASSARNRVLRQALGYCWSVAVAALPDPGLEWFGELSADPNPDAQWIVRENSKKTRLAMLL